MGRRVLEPFERAFIAGAVAVLREDRSVADVVADLKESGVPEMTARWALKGGNMTLAQFARLARALGMTPAEAARRIRFYPQPQP